MPCLLEPEKGEKGEKARHAVSSPHAWLKAILRYISFSTVIKPAPEAILPIARVDEAPVKSESLLALTLQYFPFGKLGVARPRGSGHTLLAHPE